MTSQSITSNTRLPQSDVFRTPILPPSSFFLENSSLQVLDLPSKLSFQHFALQSKNPVKSPQMFNMMLSWEEKKRLGLKIKPSHSILYLRLR